MSESYSMSESVYVDESSQPISTSEKHDLSSADLNSHFQLPAVFFKDTLQTPVEMVSHQSQLMNTRTHEGSGDWTSQDFIECGLRSIPQEVLTEKGRRKTGRKLNNKKSFDRIFRFDDEKKILMALRETCQTRVDTEFWMKAGGSLNLSFPDVEKGQVYQKVRLLKNKFLKRYINNKKKNNNNHAMSQEEWELYSLSHKIWKEEAKSLKCHQEYKKTPAVIVDESGVNLEKSIAALTKDYVHFPVEKALNLVPPSKRSKLLRKWKNMHASMIQQHMTRLDLVQETMRALVSSSSIHLK
ncbi:unnamed protein product [Lactuca virosa]|uniref:Glabrous enhancer-binding protein-like DBD domain-containing protein n=1 Tax=Lactuca virosa TaxID=75947 RepID=A0AAU9NPP3_9ASTR|nr:unnamed protein product [Lactuca virosa]